MYGLEDRSCAVTGGGGFIGTHLVRGLLQAGARRVVAVDSLSRPDPPPVSSAVERVRLTLGTDPVPQLVDALRGCDYVFHLAALKHRAAQDAPRALLSTNVTGTWEVLAAAAQVGARKVVFSSSLFAHGGRQTPAQREDDPARPDTLYGVTKLLGEHLFRASGLPHVCLRYFFVYGPGQHAGQGYPSVIVRNFRRIRAGQAPTVYGDGRQVLDYVYVDDVVEATLRAVESPLAGGGRERGLGRARRRRRPRRPHAPGGRLVPAEGVPRPRRDRGHLARGERGPGAARCWAGGPARRWTRDWPARGPS